MAGIKFTSGSQPIPDTNFNGGLNSTSGPLSVKNTESSDLQNIDFNKFGSIVKRNGYSILNEPDSGSFNAKVLVLGGGGSASSGGISNNPTAGAGSVLVYDASRNLTKGTSYAVVIGSGGTLPFPGDFAGQNGGDSTFDGIISYGGNCPLTYNTAVGGSNSSYTGGTGQLSGGSYDGGGGAGGGGNGSTKNGGIGVSNSISGSSLGYGGGGAGGRNGGTGTAVDGGAHWYPDGAATSNRGGGGSYGYDGASGCVIIRYSTSSGIGTGGTITTDGTDTIHTFTSSGTFTSPGNFTGTYSDGLHWYEFVSTGSYNSKLVDISNGKFYKIDGLDGILDDVTGSTIISSGNFCDFENWLNTVYVTNNADIPFQWTGTGNATQMPSFGSNLYTFKVNSVSASPAVGDTYTNNTVTYTITFISLISGSGSIIASGSGAPETNGILTRTSGSGDATITFTSEAANINLSKAKTVTQYNNYLFLGNVVVAGITHKSRIVWSNIKDDLTWLATSFIDIAKDDGQSIQRIIVLGDRLVVFKERAIYNVFFTGDADIPFTVQKSESNVGTVGPFSVQEIENGLVFLSHDGFYYYDANNSYKISLQIQTTLLGYNTTRFSQARSMKQTNKNRYFCALPSNGQTQNDIVVAWDWQLNAFSLYGGISAAAMTTVFTSAIDERIYFADYSGYIYRMDNGVDDYPLGVQTAINAYYYTNWKHYDDITDQKGIPNIVVYYQTNNAVMTLVYSYDFENADTYTQTFSTATSSSVYGSAIYGVDTYAGIGGGQQRRDLDGRGRVIRIGFKNNIMGETFQIDGLGSFVHLETNV